MGARSLKPHYDAVIIGCGMAGLAAGIRMAMYDRSVLIVESHNAPGGLNSFYALEGRKFDVGLHAVTNYVPPGAKGTPLVKLLRQLRLRREDLDLCPQRGSRIAFPGIDLAFDNGFARLGESVAEAFPAEIDGFRALRAHVAAFDPFDDTAPVVSAREVMGRYLRSPVLTDMLLCPILYYGSARENDIDFDQFVILWRSLFEEGFARPHEGVRVVIRALLKRFREAGGERKMKCGVRRLHTDGARVTAVELEDGLTVTADAVLSTAGARETEALWSATDQPAAPEPGRRLSFVETITVLDAQPADLGAEETIIFFNDSERFHYERPAAAVDPRSGVICFPNNYDYGERRLDEGFFRVTALADYDRWAALSPEAYRAEKDAWYPRLQESALRFVPGLDMDTVRAHTRYIDMFTPCTVKRFTRHIEGAVYGAPRKHRDGTTRFDNLFLAGTDQGFLGITGAMLSGISMANRHVLSRR
ncbi:MAG: NAD(P)/FAD-dependent oxidoreductase [Opitutales bacterium]|nr:NAD(P)/FAD-dependent oxidoreductase [Opitutales bacterium]